MSQEGREGSREEGVGMVVTATERPVGGPEEGLQGLLHRDILGH